MSEQLCPPEHDHGRTTVCYVWHRCRCAACKRNRADQQYRRRIAAALNRPVGLIPARGVMRRLQALGWLGWDQATLARLLRMNPKTVRTIANGRAKQVTADTVRRVSVLYDKLSMTHREGTTLGERQVIIRTRRRAEQLGWPPPLAWDDIDHDRRPKQMNRQGDDSA